MVWYSPCDGYIRYHQIYAYYWRTNKPVYINKLDDLRTIKMIENCETWRVNKQSAWEIRKLARMLGDHMSLLYIQTEKWYISVIRVPCWRLIVAVAKLFNLSIVDGSRVGMVVRLAAGWRSNWRRTAEYLKGSYHRAIWGDIIRKYYLGYIIEEISS